MLVKPGLLLRLWVFALLAGGCAAAPTAVFAPPPAVTPAPAAGFPLPPTLTAQPPATPSPTPTSSPPPTLTSTSAQQICSPLAGFSQEALKKAVSNPFNPPPKPGSDDPHQAVDFADLLPGTRVAVEGRGVQAALAGRIASVIADRFPYGNAVIIETPLERLPASWLETLNLPAPNFDSRPASALTCPPLNPPPAWNRQQRSLYLLYAHLKQPSALKPGTAVACGEALGVIGQTGNALNPHLHLEARSGPAGAQFASLAHYTASASPQEMAAYCTWRISGIFPLVDPLRLLAFLP